MSVAVEFHEVAKSFGPVRVLHNVSFALEPGRIYALIGENGAGKSTLMKILAGYESLSGGELRINGRAVHFSGSRAAEAEGIVLIHQEFNLAEDLTIAQNIFLGHEKKRGWLLDDDAMRAEAARVLGALFGLAHGLLITRGRIEPFIVTLGTLGIYGAYLTYFAGGGAITLDNVLSDVYSPVYYGSLLGVFIPVLVFAMVSVAGAVILNRTAYGRYVRAIGSNEQVARYAAVDVDRIKVITYMLLGTCVGVATLLYVPRLGSASPSTGLLWELEAIAAVIVGGTARKGGAGSITGTVIGAILLSVISNILNLTNIISVYLNAAVQGFVIIIVAFMQRKRK